MVCEQFTTAILEVNYSILAYSITLKNIHKHEKIVYCIHMCTLFVVYYILIAP